MNNLIHQLESISNYTVAQLDAHPKASGIMNGTMSKKDYYCYLRMAGRQVAGSAAMLTGAGRRLVELGRLQLGTFLLVKAAQERNHELWAFADADNLHVTDAGSELTLAASAVETFRTTTTFLTRAAPLAILGVSYQLESLALARAGQAADNLRKNGIPEDSLTFLRGHATADVQHVAELNEVLTHVSDASEVDTIVLGAKFTSLYYVNLFE